MSFAAPSSEAEGSGCVLSGPSVFEKKLIERRGKRQLSALKLDCIRPFSFNSDTLCILSAPATHIRLQTVPCTEGFVLHKCIDIRTHEFFLYPQSISSYGQHNIISDSVVDIPMVGTARTSCNILSAASGQNDITALHHSPTQQDKYGDISTDRTLADSVCLSGADHPLSRILQSPGHGDSSCSPHTSPTTSPRRASDCEAACRRSYSEAADTEAGCSGGSSMALLPSGGGGRRARKAGRRSRSPGTPRNVDSVAWFVGAGLTGATIRPPSRRRRRHGDAPAYAPAISVANADAVNAPAVGAVRG
jgi:hypothetical protein